MAAYFEVLVLLSCYCFFFCVGDSLVRVLCCSNGRRCCCSNTVLLFFFSHNEEVSNIKNTCLHFILISSKYFFT